MVRRFRIKVIDFVLNGGVVLYWGDIVVNSGGNGNGTKCLGRRSILSGRNENKSFY